VCESCVAKANRFDQQLCGEQNPASRRLSASNE